MKKTCKKLVMLLLSLTVMFCMAFPVSAASINKKKVTVCTGQTVQLKVNGVKKKARWTSSNKSVATVTQKGKVSAKKKGNATVTAKIGNKKYTCKVTVESPKLSKTSITVKNGKTYQLKMQNTKQKYKWSSKNKSIATVTSKGKVTGKKTGTTYIYAKSASGKIFKCKVIVKKSASSGGSFSDGSGSSPVPKPTVKTYELGQTWTVPGQWRMTINSVTEMSERNPYTNTNPEAVYLVDYTYENIGYTSSYFDGLFMSLGLYRYIDSQGYAGYTYPNSKAYYPEELPIGAKCRAQECIGVNHRGNFKIYVDEYAGNSDTKYSAIFNVPIN